MANPVLELTFSGLCVLVVGGKEGVQNPSSLEAVLVPTTDGHGHDMPKHLPRLSFRALDLGKASGISNLPLVIDSAGDEIVSISLDEKQMVPVEVEWEKGSSSTQFNLTWFNSQAGTVPTYTEMNWAPNIDKLQIKKIHTDGTNAAARVLKLPYGDVTTRRIVEHGGVLVEWYFRGPDDDAQVIANQVTLTSTASSVGESLFIRVGQMSFALKPPANEPLRISITNLPAITPVQVDLPKPNEPIHHLAWFGDIADPKKTLGNGDLPKRKAAPLQTKQGTICPTLRYHLEK